MINNSNKIKNILSKLMVAKKSYKKVIQLKKTNITKVFLELLQKKGFIYGYNYNNCSYKNDFYIVFIKYSENNNYLWKNLTFLNKHINFKNLKTFEKNSLYLVLNKKGYFLDTLHKKSKLKGYIIAKF